MKMLNQVQHDGLGARARFAGVTLNWFQGLIPAPCHPERVSGSLDAETSSA